jgi:hypothetical protein
MAFDTVPLAVARWITGQPVDQHGTDTHVLGDRRRGPSSVGVDHCRTVGGLRLYAAFMAC